MTKRIEVLEADVERTLATAGVYPQVECYMDYAKSKWTGRSNYGSHSMCFYFAGIRMWFSYETMIAFQASGGQQIVRENDWNQTTGRHLQAAQQGYGKRYPSEEFWVLFADAVVRAGVAKVPRFCVYEEKPKSPLRKMLRKIGYRKPSEPVIAPVTPSPKKERMHNYPKKLTRLEKLAAGFNFDEYDEEIPEEVLA